MIKNSNNFILYQPNYIQNKMFPLRSLLVKLMSGLFFIEIIKKKVCFLSADMTQLAEKLSRAEYDQNITFSQLSDEIIVKLSSHFLIENVVCKSVINAFKAHDVNCHTRPAAWSNNQEIQCSKKHLQLGCINNCSSSKDDEMLTNSSSTAILQPWKNCFLYSHHNMKS